VSDILNAVHETAKGLSEVGLITKNRMQEYDALCIAPVPLYDQSKIKALRSRYHLSQAVFAAVLNTSLSTVRQWEIGDKKPSGTSLKLLNILDRKGLEALI
jgi:putative transcriptional regulator